METTTLTVLDLINLAKQAEAQAQRFYKELMHSYSDIPEASFFWKQLHEDELKHFNSLNEIQEALSHDTLCEPISPTTYGLLNGIVRDFKRIKTESFQNFEEAFRAAHEMENGEINGIFRFIMKNYASAEIRKRYLASEIEEHQTRFSQLPKVISSPELRKKLLPKKFG